MNLQSAPAVANLGKLRQKLTASEAEGLKGKLNEFGINMVDLMMWLVIAALLLAAALQGIGYYQQAAWTYQAKSDVASVRTYVEASYTLNNNAYSAFDTSDSTKPQPDASLKLTGQNIAAVKSDGTGGWVGTVESAGLHGATKSAFFNFGSKNPAGATYDYTSSSIPASATDTNAVISKVLA